MSEGAAPGEGAFEVSADPETIAFGEYEGANVCRLTALTSLFGGDPRVVTDIAVELRDLGFSSRLTEAGAGWDPGGEFEDERWPPISVNGSSESKIVSWLRLNEAPSRDAARAFALSMLASARSRESVAAAAFLWREIPSPEADDLMLSVLYPRRYAFRRFLFGEGWLSLLDDLWRWLTAFRDFDDDVPASLSPESWRVLLLELMDARLSRWRRMTLLGLLVRWRLEHARRFSDAISQSLAAAVLLPFGHEAPVTEPSTGGAARDGVVSVSTIIHGTWGWKGRWWRPRADFHDFILRRHRSDLFSKGTRYSWSGAYSARQRAQASEDFLDWAEEVAPGGLRTLFGHSYGGEIAARSILKGCPVEELVLLSAPANRIVRAAADDGVRIVDVRLRFDPVLALAGTRQRVQARPNVTQVLLSRWTLDHGATHDVPVWISESVAARGGL